MKMNNAYLGMNGFVWWIGVVEDRIDPLKMGRCRIRIFGWHTEDKTQIPTEDLPWAQPVLPINNSDEFSTPREGDWVMGFFMDGASGQFPIYTGVLAGIPKPYTNNPQKGFTDPRNGTQLNSAPKKLGESATNYPRYPEEPTSSRVYRNEKIDTTLIGKRNAALTKGVAIAGGGTWDEPKSTYAAVPPYDDVKETESGHLFEMDDTPNAERINLAHRTGTFFEIYPDGSQVTKIKGKNYEIVAGDDFVNIQGNCNITVNGNANVKVLKNVKMEVTGNFDAAIGGHCYIDSKGNMKLTAPRIDLNP